MFLASQGSHVECLKYLIAEKADVNVPTKVHDLNRRRGARSGFRVEDVGARVFIAEAGSAGGGDGRWEGGREG